MTYPFNKIFAQYIQDQSVVYQEAVLPIIDEFFCEKNALLFVHGLSGSGKNYTLFGENETKADVGLMQHVFETLFASTSDRKNQRFVIFKILLIITSKRAFLF